MMVLGSQLKDANKRDSVLLEIGSLPSPEFSSLYLVPFPPLSRAQPAAATLASGTSWGPGVPNRAPEPSGAA